MMMVVRGRFLSASSPMKTGIATPQSAAPIRSRVGRAFDRLLDRIEANGVRIILVEDAGRFARDLVVQELGIALQDKRGVWLLTASGDDLTDSDDLGRKMMCQVSRRLHGVRKGSPGRRIAGWARTQAQGDRQEGWRQKVTRRALAGGGRRSASLRRVKGKGGRLSYREISARLKDAGYCNERGQPFNPQSVRAMIVG